MYESHGRACTAQTGQGEPSKITLGCDESFFKDRGTQKPSPHRFLHGSGRVGDGGVALSGAPGVTKQCMFMRGWYFTPPPGEARAQTKVDLAAVWRETLTIEHGRRQQKSENMFGDPFCEKLLSQTWTILHITVV